MNSEIRPSTYADDYWLSVDAPGRRPPTDASGKWLVFVRTEEVDRWWELIAHAIEAGELGQSAKVATARPSPHARSSRERVIVVYTNDWRDRDDVRRVLRELRSLGVSWRLAYKPDDATVSGRYGRGSSIYISPPGSDDFRDTT